MRFGVCILFFCYQLSCIAQVNTGRLITIEADNQRLDVIFNQFSEQHGVNIRYGFDNINTSQRLTLHFRQETLSKVLNEICKKANLEFMIIGNAIVFKNVANRTIKTSPIVREKPDSSLLIVKLESALPRKDTTLSVLTNSAQQIIYATPVMDSSVVIIPRQHRKRTYGGFICTSSDYHTFRFKPTELPQQTYRSEFGNSIGIGGYLSLKSKIYFSAGADLIRKNFSLQYNFQVSDPDDPMPIPQTTHVSLYYIAIPIAMGVPLYSVKKSVVLLQTGVTMAHRIDHTENTCYNNSSAKDTGYFLKSDNDTLAETTLSIIYHHYLYKNLGLYIQSDYSLILNEVNHKAISAYSHVVSIKGGIRFLFINKLYKSNVL